MYSVRLWSVRNARALHRLYAFFSRLAPRLAPLVRRIGVQHVETVLRPLEQGAKNVFFDCRMCGQCVLSSTGMSCPMNCPKNLRNGPCGGVRPGGFCEVKPQMRCVWVLAWDGAARMQGGGKINDVQPPVNRSLEGSSSWLRVAREKAARPAGPSDAPRNTIARAFPTARAHEPAAAPLAPEPPSASHRGNRH